MHKSSWRPSRLFVAAPIRYRSLSTLEDAMMNKAEEWLEEGYRQYHQANDRMRFAPDVGVCRIFLRKPNAKAGGGDKSDVREDLADGVNSEDPRRRDIEAEKEGEGGD